MISITLKTWSEVNLAPNLKPIIHHLRVASLYRHSTRTQRAPLDQIFLRGKIEETLLITALRIFKRIASTTIKKTVKVVVVVEISTINFTLIQLKELSKWCESNINQLLWWDLIKINKLSKCKIWIIIVLKCIKVTMVANLWMITEWACNLIIKCINPTQTSNIKIHQNHQGF